MSPRRLALVLLIAPALPIAAAATSPADATSVNLGACDLAMHAPLIEDTLHEVYRSPAGPAAQTVVGTACSL